MAGSLERGSRDMQGLGYRASGLGSLGTRDSGTGNCSTGFGDVYDRGPLKLWKLPRHAVCVRPATLGDAALNSFCKPICTTPRPSKPPSRLFQTLAPQNMCTCCRSV